MLQPCYHLPPDSFKVWRLFRNPFSFNDGCTDVDHLCSLPMEWQLPSLFSRVVHITRGLRQKPRYLLHLRYRRRIIEVTGHSSFTAHAYPSFRIHMTHHPTTSTTPAPWCPPLAKIIITKLEYAKAYFLEEVLMSTTQAAIREIIPAEENSCYTDGVVDPVCHKSRLSFHCQRHTGAYR